MSLPHTLDQLITDLALHVAHSRGLPLASAERTIRKLVDEAWTEYRDAGAPLGDDDAGLAQWIMERAQRVRTA